MSTRQMADFLTLSFYQTSVSYTSTVDGSRNFRPINLTYTSGNQFVDGWRMYVTGDAAPLIRSPPGSVYQYELTVVSRHGHEAVKVVQIRRKMTQLQRVIHVRLNVPGYHQNPTQDHGGAFTIIDFGDLPILHPLPCLNKESMCPICYNDDDAHPGLWIQTPCNHHFHRACLSKWIRQAEQINGPTNATCPFCGTRITQQILKTCTEIRHTKQNSDGNVVRQNGNPGISRSTDNANSQQGGRKAKRRPSIMKALPKRKTK